MKSVKDIRENIFIVERKGKATMFFLLKRETEMDMEFFMKTHNIGIQQLNDNSDKIMDFYNDMIKFQNKEKSYINHITVFNFKEYELMKYVKNIEEDVNFIKWIGVEDKIWLDKIYKYFISPEWFDNSDNIEPQYNK